MNVDQKQINPLQFNNANFGHIGQFKVNFKVILRSIHIRDNLHRIMSLFEFFRYLD